MSIQEPSTYQGQILCERCGDDGTGNRFYICADTTPDGRKFTHDESCATYNYDGLCTRCDAQMREEYPDA